MSTISAHCIIKCVKKISSQDQHNSNHQTWKFCQKNLITTGPGTSLLRPFLQSILYVK
uniref:Uncharacterized protein n=1 Tax=Rhizophora mucronata TaxID=61149 RepID=A0A2P2N5U0_RHIMU